MSDSRGSGLLVIGRFLISVVFILGGISKIMGFSPDVAAAVVRHIPLPVVATGVAMLIELLGGFAILTGLYTKLASWALFLYLIPTTLVFHRFWTYDADLQAGHMVMFEKNLAIMGGLLVLALHGAGSFSLDSLRKRNKT